MNDTGQDTLYKAASLSDSESDDEHLESSVLDFVTNKYDSYLQVPNTVLFTNDVNLTQHYAESSGFEEGFKGQLDYRLQNQYIPT